MDNTDKVVGFLQQKMGDWYCDSCISEATGVKPPNQVNQITRPLGRAGSSFKRIPKQTCTGCDHLRTCTKAWSEPAQPPRNTFTVAAPVSWYVPKWERQRYG